MDTDGSIKILVLVGVGVTTDVAASELVSAGGFCVVDAPVSGVDVVSAGTLSSSWTGVGTEAGDSFEGSGRIGVSGVVVASESVEISSFGDTEGGSGGTVLVGFPGVWLSEEPELGERDGAGASSWGVPCVASEGPPAGMRDKSELSSTETST